MTSDPYTTDVLQLAADIPHIGRLENPDVSVHRVARLCGSTLDLDLTITDGAIDEIGLEIEACALGQAAASVFSRNAIGLTEAEINAGRDQLKALLKDGTPLPAGPFEALNVLAPAKDYPARHGSILLALEAAVEAFEQIKARQD